MVANERIGISKEVIIRIIEKRIKKIKKNIIIIIRIRNLIIIIIITTVITTLNRSKFDRTNIVKKI